MTYTYKISGNSKPKMEALVADHAIDHRIRRYRCVLITAKKLDKAELADVNVHERSQGQDRFKEWTLWTMSTLLEELEIEQREYEVENTITAKRQVSACDKWLETRLDLEAAKREVEKLIKRHEKASRNVFKMHGRIPTRLQTSIDSEGDIHDVTYIRENIMYIKRRGG